MNLSFKKNNCSIQKRGVEDESIEPNSIAHI